MQLIVGLGNPGRKYRGTPHNLGYEVVELIATRAGLTFKASRKLRGYIASGKLAGCNIFLLKPTTYMNLSGEAVRDFLRHFALELSNLLIVSDDINLPMGSLRFRQRGSHGGHKGLLSIIQCLGTEDFARLRAGVHPCSEVDDYTAFVLTRLSGEERDVMKEMKKVAADAVECFLREGFNAAAARYNKLDLPYAQKLKVENSK